MNINIHFEQTKKNLEMWSLNPSISPQVKGVFECHIFCDPLNPTPAQIKQFAESCDHIGVKPLCLGLNFKGQGVINVLQTSKYYQCEDVPTAVSFLLRDAELLQRDHDVIRLKLESLATNAGVPQNMEEESQIPGDCYFEFHLKINSAPTLRDDQLLKTLSDELTQELNIPIPFSCNNMRVHAQRFLNARTYGMGIEESYKIVNRVVEAVEDRNFEVTKIIREFIVFDTNKELDRGWLEF